MPFASLEYQTHTKCLYFPSPSPPLSSIEFSLLMVQIFAGAAFDFGAFDCASFPLFQNLWRVLSKKEVKVWDPTHSTVSDWWFWNIATVGFVSLEKRKGGKCPNVCVWVGIKLFCIFSRVNSISMPLDVYFGFYLFSLLRGHMFVEEDGQTYKNSFFGGEKNVNLICLPKLSCHSFSFSSKSLSLSFCWAPLMATCQKCFKFKIKLFKLKF